MNDMYSIKDSLASQTYMLMSKPYEVMSFSSLKVSKQSLEEHLPMTL